MVNKSLVTGGAGFIGSHLVDLLLKEGHEVIVIDNESSDAHEQFYWNNSCENHILDICDFETIESLFDGVDFVFHLAAESRIMNTINNPPKAVLTNALGTANVLQASKTHGIKRLVYSSTSSVYGMNEAPNCESDNIDCLNPYSVSKYAGEELCRMYSRLYNLETCVLRYFNAYGERQPIKGPYSPVIGVFKRQLEAGEEMTIVGDGLQSRDFVHVSDIARANLLCINQEELVNGQPINIGTGFSFSVLDIAKMLDGKFTFIPERPGEARITKADTDRAKSILKWEPLVKLENWIKENK